MALRPGSLPEVTANGRAYLLALRHADPERLGRLLSDGTRRAAGLTAPTACW